jgi:hypothetical protein
MRASILLGFLVFITSARDILNSQNQDLELENEKKTPFGPCFICQTISASINALGLDLVTKDLKNFAT